MTVGFGYYLQLIVTLSILIAVSIGVLRYTKVIQKKKFSGEIQVLDRLAIDTNVTLMIVDVRHQQYLLSVGGKDVKVLEKI